METNGVEAGSMKKELAPERSAFLADEFELGFIAYCGIRAKDIRPGFF